MLFGQNNLLMDELQPAEIFEPNFIFIMEKHTLRFTQISICYCSSRDRALFTHQNTAFLFSLTGKVNISLGHQEKSNFFTFLSYFLSISVPNEIRLPAWLIHPSCHIISTSQTYDRVSTLLYISTRTVYTSILFVFPNVLNIDVGLIK